MGSITPFLTCSPCYVSVPSVPQVFRYVPVFWFFGFSQAFPLLFAALTLGPTRHDTVDQIPTRPIRSPDLVGPRCPDPVPRPNRRDPDPQSTGFSASAVVSFRDAACSVSSGRVEYSCSSTVRPLSVLLAPTSRPKIYYLFRDEYISNINLCLDYNRYYAAPAPTFKDELEPKQIEGMDRNGIPYYGRHFLLQEMALRHPHEILTMTGRLALSCGAEEPGLELMPRGAFAAQVVAGPISDGDLERSVGFDNLDDGKSLFDPEKVRLRHITRGYDVVGIPLTLIASGSLSEAMSKVSGLEERFRKEDIFVSEYAVIDSGFHLFKAMTWTGALGRNFQWLAEGKSGWFSDEANANAYVSSLFGHKTKYTGVKEFAPRRSLKLFHLMDNENLSLLTATILAQGRTPKALKDLEVVQVATGFGVTWPDQLKKAVDRKWIKSRDLMSFTRCEDLARFCTGVSDDAGSCHDGFVGLRQDGTADEGDLRRAIETETEEVKLITISGEEGTEKETIWGPRLHDLNRLSTQKSDAELAKVIEEYLGGNYQGYYAGDAPSLDLSLAGTWPAELARMGQVGMNFFPQEICLFSMADVRDVV